MSTNCYHFNIKLTNIRNNHAGSKAVEDCKSILLNNGFNDIEVSFIKRSYMMPFNLIKLFASMALFSVKIKTGSLIVVQYPLLGINKYFKYFAKMLKAKRCKLICIIHDIDSIRSNDNGAKITHEIDALNVYDAVIAHNNAMVVWLNSNGFKGKTTTINFFDYLVSDEISLKDSRNNKDVVFAGNLGRCLFLDDLNKVSEVKFNLYGPGLDDAILKNSSNVTWNGSFTPEQIVSKLNGAYGLIWDGTSIENCIGLYGNYLRYNTPHKASLYFVSGLPIIAPATSAIAAYVVERKLGMIVNSLKDLPKTLAQVTQQQYSEFKSNVEVIGEQLKNGHNLKSAIDELVKQGL
jgi:hypothetical protein